MNLNIGDMCYYEVKAQCGVPSFLPSSNNLTYLDIFTIEYDDSDSIAQSSSSSLTPVGATALSVPLPSQQVSLDPSNPVFGYSIITTKSQLISINTLWLTSFRATSKLCSITHLIDLVTPPNSRASGRTHTILTSTRWMRQTPPSQAMKSSSPTV